jgi:hypothetical protein
MHTCAHAALIVYEGDCTCVILPIVRSCDAVSTALVKKGLCMIDEEIPHPESRSEPLLVNVQADKRTLERGTNMCMRYSTRMHAASRTNAKTQPPPRTYAHSKGHGMLYLPEDEQSAALTMGQTM